MLLRTFVLALQWISSFSELQMKKRYYTGFFFFFCFFLMFIYLTKDIFYLLKNFRFIAEGECVNLASEKRIIH